MNTEETILSLVKQIAPDNPLQYVHNIVRDYSMEQTKKLIIDCKDCSICNSRKTIPNGDYNASILIIGDNPVESQEGIVGAFNNDLKETLDKVWDFYNIDKDKLLYTNVVNCFPYKQNGEELIHRSPNKSEVENCSSFVYHVIRIVQPRVILLLGGIASNLFYKEAISKIRGQWLNFNNIPMMPTYHPRYLLEIEGKKDKEVVETIKDDFVNDIGMLIEYLKENYPDDNTFIKE